MRVLKLGRILLLLALLGGCVTPVVQTRATNFYGPEYAERGSISVISADPTQEKSLEFGSYKSKIESKLSGVGYSIGSSPTDSKYVAIVSYGIDNGKSETVLVPVFGQTGGGTTFSSGRIGNTGYSGTSYTMPTFGVVGASSSSETTYTRVIAIDIVNSASIQASAPKKIYEMRAKSVGTCPVINGVFNEILEAMFINFPGENGRTQMIEIPMKGSC